MPQIFQVLRCYKCFVFQVHQTKKLNKWECKLCGEKQSIKRHYGLGTAKDCRLHVQKLNGMRGEMDGMMNNKDLESNNSENEDNTTQPIKDNSQPIKYSKWSNYIEETEALEENIHEDMSLGDVEVVLEIPKKRRKQCSNKFKRNLEVSTVEKIDIASPETIPIMRINTVSIPSNTPQQGFVEDVITEKESLKKINHNIKNKFIPPVLNKHSKWAQFTEDAEESEKTDKVPSPTIETSQNDLWFSLCDDNDLDNVLNI